MVGIVVGGVVDIQALAELHVGLSTTSITPVLFVTFIGCMADGRRYVHHIVVVL